MYKILFYSVTLKLKRFSQFPTLNSISSRVCIDLLSLSLKSVTSLFATVCAGVTLLCCTWCPRSEPLTVQTLESYWTENKVTEAKNCNRNPFKTLEMNYLRLGGICE